MSTGPKLTEDDFRRHRQYLPDDAFAYIKGKYAPATSPMPKRQWNSLMNLPDDVLLRTTDHQGGQLAQLHNLWGMWVELLPLDTKEALFIRSAGWDAADDFNAASFMAAHGYYRQAMASLRSALEQLTIAAAFAARNDEAKLGRWLAGQGQPPKFGNARDNLRPTLGSVVTEVLNDLQRVLSGYHHAQASTANAAIWQSNGPVWTPEAFTAFYRAFRDTMAMCLVMLCIGWPEFQIPGKCRELFKSPGGMWNEVETSVIDRWLLERIL